MEKEKIKEKATGFKNKMLTLISKNKVLSIAIISIIAILFVIIISISCKSNVGNTSGNLYNNGFSVEHNGILYYSEYDGLLNGIYKVKGNKKTKISDDRGIYLNISGNNIYYMDLNNSNIVKMKLNGKNKKVIVKNVDLTKITLVDDWIYYFEQSSLYKIKTNGKGKKKLSTKLMKNYEIVGNWIYYSYMDDGKYVIAKVKTNGKSNKIVSEDVGKAFFLVGNNIYYIYEDYDFNNFEYKYQLYRMKQNGKNKSKVTDFNGEVEVDTINLNGNEIYYAKSNEEEKLGIYKIKLNGKNETKIADLNLHFTKLNLHDKWIYYMNVENSQEMKIQTYRIRTNGKDEQTLSNM